MTIGRPTNRPSTRPVHRGEHRPGAIQAQARHRSPRPRRHVLRGSLQFHIDVGRRVDERRDGRAAGHRPGGRRVDLAAEPERVQHVGAEPARRPAKPLRARRQLLHPELGDRAGNHDDPRRARPAFQCPGLRRLSRPGRPRRTVRADARGGGAPHRRDRIDPRPRAAAAAQRSRHRRPRWTGAGPRLWRSIDRPRCPRRSGRGTGLDRHHRTTRSIRRRHRLLAGRADLFDRRRGVRRTARRSPDVTPGGATDHRHRAARIHPGVRSARCRGPRGLRRRRHLRTSEHRVELDHGSRGGGVGSDGRPTSPPPSNRRRGRSRGHRDHLSRPCP